MKIMVRSEEKKTANAGRVEHIEARHSLLRHTGQGMSSIQSQGRENETITLPSLVLDTGQSMAGMTVLYFILRVLRDSVFKFFK